MVHGILGGVDKLTQEEWNNYLKQVFPNEILGFKRPEEGIPTDLDFSTYFPQFISKDPAYFLKLNAFLRQGFSNDKVLNLMIDEIKKQLANCDLRLATQVLKGLMSANDKKKLDGIAEGATKYVHPESHPATMITQDSTHRFITDTEKTIWNSKADGNHGNHVPKLETADNSRFLRNDGTFQSVTPEGIGAAREIYSDNIKIEGDANKYYCVGFNCSNGYDGKPVRLNIRRHMNVDENSKGFLDFEMTGISGDWGGCPRHYITKYYGDNFVAKADIGNRDRLLLVWLRGQTTYYWGCTHSIKGIVMGESGVLQNDTIISAITSLTLPKGVAINGVSVATTNQVVRTDADSIMDNSSTPKVIHGATGKDWGLSWNPVALVAYDWTNSRTIWNYEPSSSKLALMPTSGIVTSPTPDSTDNSTKVATTAFVQAVSKANSTGIVASSLGEIGWAKYANGLIKQWGRVSIAALATATVTLPIEYKTSIYTISTTLSRLNGYRGDKQDWVGASINSLQSIKIFNGLEEGGVCMIFWETLGV